VLSWIKKSTKSPSNSIHQNDIVYVQRINHTTALAGGFILSKNYLESERVKFKNIKYRQDDNVAHINIDCPPTNAFSGPLIDELSSIFGRLSRDETIRSLLITSTNKKVFLSGGDIKSSEKHIKSGDIDEQVNYVRSVQQVVSELERMPKPTVAAINGHVLGGGFELVMACDFRLASDDNKIQLGMPEIDLGFIPAVGGLQRIGKKFGQHLALKMGLGLRLTPKDAFGIGLVDELYAPGDLLKESMLYAKRLSTLPTRAIALIKRLILDGSNLQLTEVYELELRCLKKVLQTNDVKEGINAFLEKRSPQFSGN
jgi:enoyl-CoA hydratase/carnithine racemase